MQLTRHHLMPHMKYLGEITALGMASGINQVAMAIIQITMNNILRKYGAQFLTMEQTFRLPVQVLFPK